MYKKCHVSFKQGRYDIIKPKTR